MFLWNSCLSDENVKQRNSWATKVYCVLFPAGWKLSISQFSDTPRTRFNSFWELSLLEKRLRHRYFPVDFAKFLRTPFYRTPPGDCSLTKFCSSHNQDHYHYYRQNEIISDWYNWLSSTDNLMFKKQKLL